MKKLDIHQLISKVDKELSEDPENKESLGWFRDMFGNLPSSQLDELNFFIEKMPKDNDLLKIVITGHLLVEKQVKVIFHSNFLNETPLKSCRLETSQIISLSEAMYESTEESSTLWKCIKKLNNIRNDLAHNLEFVGIEHKISDFIKQVNSINSIPIEKSSCIEDDLRHCITVLSAIVISLSTHASEDRKAKNKAAEIAKKFKYDYVGFDNQVNEIIYDSKIDRGKRDRFSKCLNKNYLKMLGALDVTNSEYIDATYGALLAAIERKEFVEPKELKSSFIQLQEQHSKIISDIKNHFITIYNEITEQIHNELKTELNSALSEVSDSHISER